MTERRKSIFWKFFHRYFIVGLNGMALGLFCTLIIGLILKQISTLFPGDIANLIFEIGVIATVLTGPVIGIGVAHALDSPKLVILSSGVVGFIGAFGSSFYSGKIITKQVSVLISSPGDPLGAFLSVVVACEIGRLVSGKTKIDIIITPLVTILTGSFVAYVCGPYLLSAMKWLGDFIKVSTELQPFLMGIIVSVLMGMILTLPISSAALSIILGLSGIASGAATVGCSCQMIGFAVISFNANGWNGLLSQGLGTSMLQVPNIMRKPVIWIPPIVASAILGPVSTLIFKMKNNPAGGGMGTSGLVGQLMTYKTMFNGHNSRYIIVSILILHFILPSIISYLVYRFMKSKRIIVDADYKLEI